MTKLDLLPCPFCGGNNLRGDPNGSSKYKGTPWNIRCYDCTCHVHGLNKAQTTEKWNRRTALSKPGWISVKDDLPKKYETVAILNDGVERTAGFLAANEWNLHTGARVNVTHWMSLPEPQATAAPAISRWLSVKDKLPQDSERVLVAAKDDIVSLGYQFQGHWSCHSYSLDDGDVTHWMPLPTAPAQGE